jgi:Protein of unknown function (DUF1003)
VTRADSSADGSQTRAGSNGLIALPAKLPHNPVVLEQQAQRAANIQLRVADWITAFAGSMNFVYLHIVLFTVWMLFIESKPWPTLTLVVSLEAIFLSTFVMIGQNRQATFQQAASQAASPRAAAESQPAGLRPQVRLPVPAAAGTLAAFAANGLFAGLSGLFLATTLHQSSHALSGAALFLVFASGVAFQLATTRLRGSQVLVLGTVSMLAGLVLLVVSVRLSTPSLALFLIAGALIGAGSGAVFKGMTGIVLAASPPQSRVAMTSALLIALYVGLSVPVIGAGIALDLGASAPDTVLGFAILVGLGVTVSGWAMLGAKGRRSGGDVLYVR